MCSVSLTANTALLLFVILWAFVLAVDSKDL